MRLFSKTAVDEIELKPFPFKKELFMEAYIIENPLVLKGDSEDMGKVEILDSEFPYSYDERDGEESKRGRIDILAKITSSEDEAESPGKYLAIIELKKDQVTKAHIEQLERYLKTFSEQGRMEEILKNADPRINYAEYSLKGIIIGREFDDETKKQLLGGYKYNDFEIIGMTLNRYKAEETGTVYIFTEVLAPPISKFSIIQLENFEAFCDYQSKNKRGKYVERADAVHTGINRILDQEGFKYEVSYGSGVISFKVPKHLASSKSRVIVRFGLLSLRDPERSYIEFPVFIKNKRTASKSGYYLYSKKDFDDQREAIREDIIECYKLLSKNEMTA